MFYKRKGMPEIGEILICKVKKILYHSVFVDLLEYTGKEGMVHISEIAPGRIRNLRDYVKENKIIICKVINITRANEIDLSLRRVGPTITAEKLNWYKQMENSEKLLSSIAKQLKLSIQKIYDLIGYKAIAKYGSLQDFYQAILERGQAPILELTQDKPLASMIHQFITQKIKPKEVKLTAKLLIKSYKPNGVDVIKNTFTQIKDKNISIKYVSAPEYRIELMGKDYKTLKTKMRKSITTLTKAITSKGSIEFIEEK